MMFENRKPGQRRRKLLIGLSVGAANTKEVLIAGEIALTTLGADKNGNISLGNS